MHRLFHCLIALLLALAAGCADDGKEQVTGSVTFDGAPLPEGRILFRKVDGDQKAFGGVISGGTYSLECEPGAMRVEITASKIIPGKFDTSNGTKEPVGVMYIPAKYNSKSELTAQVDASNREHNFDLKSK